MFWGYHHFRKHPYSRYDYMNIHECNPNINGKFWLLVCVASLPVCHVISYSPNPIEASGYAEQVCELVCFEYDPWISKFSSWKLMGFSGSTKFPDMQHLARMWTGGSGKGWSRGVTKRSEADSKIYFDEILYRECYYKRNHFFEKLGKDAMLLNEVTKKYCTIE